MDCQECAHRREEAFCNIPGPSRKLLDGFKVTSRHPAGSILFARGESPRGVYLLCKGSVRLSMPSSEERTVALRTVNAGRVLGLHAVVSDRPYQATAETREPCQVAFVERARFLCFLGANCDAALRAAQQLSADYEAACEHVRALLDRPAIEKVASFLLKATNSEHDQQGNYIQLTKTHREIGEQIGASRRMVCRALAVFKDKNFVTQQGSLLLIQSRVALEGYARRASQWTAILADNTDGRRPRSVCSLKKPEECG